MSEQTAAVWFWSLSPRKFSRKNVYAFDADAYPTLKIQKSLINQGFPIKNKNYNLGTHRIKVIVLIWSKWRDSNSRPPVPETGALPTALHLVLMIFMRFSVSGQTCGQTENLRTFKTSGEPKKSVFSRGLGVFQNFRFEIGGLHPKLARYHLRYASNL